MDPADAAIMAQLKSKICEDKRDKTENLVKVFKPIRTNTLGVKNGNCSTGQDVLGKNVDFC